MAVHPPVRIPPRASCRHAAPMAGSGRRSRLSRRAAVVQPRRGRLAVDCCPMSLLLSTTDLFDNLTISVDKLRQEAMRCRLRLAQERSRFAQETGTRAIWHRGRRDRPDRTYEPGEDGRRRLPRVCSGRGIDRYWLQVGVTNTDRELVEWLLSAYGGHISDNSHATSRASWQPCWAWRVTILNRARVPACGSPVLGPDPEQNPLPSGMGSVKSAPGD
jgi:hypothetical protein